MSTQIFAIQLLSHLCTQYALPKSLSVARLAISVMGTLLTGECCFSYLCIAVRLYTHLKKFYYYFRKSKQFVYVAALCAVGCFNCREQNDLLIVSADPCQALLFLHAHPALPGGLLSSLPSTL